MHVRVFLPLSALTASLMLAACSSAPPAPASAAPADAVAEQAGAHAVVNLAAASGSLVSGRLQITAMGDGVRVRGDIGGLNPGDARGFHIHEKGDCSAVDASSAGGHFNPAAQAHGRIGHGAHHAGDTDNIIADTNGVAHVDAHFSGVSLGTGAANDIAGRAVIVHAKSDDYASQPSGNAGARVACGVIQLVQ